MEYIIQIEPQLIDTLAKDHDLSSDVPAGLDVRRFRITVGTGKLPADHAESSGRSAARKSNSGALRMPPLGSPQRQP